MKTIRPFALFLCLMVLASNLFAQTLDEKIAQMLLIGFRGTSVESNSIIYRDINTYKIGGVILYETDNNLARKQRNIISKDQIKALTGELQALSETPMFIGIDQEGGRVQRLSSKYGFTDFKAPLELGKLDNPDETKKSAKILGSELKDVGINFNFAPSVDVMTNTKSLIIARLFRSFSSNPETVYEQAKAFKSGLDEAGVIGIFKHFPGFGSESNVKYRGFYDISDTWSENELIPYKRLLADKEVSVDVILVGHLFLKKWDETYPMSLSKKAITDKLRNELGFKGLIIPESAQNKDVIDDFGFEEGIKLQVKAGADILMFANNMIYDENLVPKVIQLVKDMVKNGEITESRITESYNRIIKLKSKL